MQPVFVACLSAALLAGLAVSAAPVRAQGHARDDGRGVRATDRDEPGPRGDLTYDSRSYDRPYDVRRRGDPRDLYDRRRSGDPRGTREEAEQRRGIRGLPLGGSPAAGVTRR